MKHIVFLAEHLSFGGAERALVELLNGIDLNKFKVSLIVRDDRGADNYLVQFVPKGIPVRFLIGHQEEQKKNVGLRAKFNGLLRKKFRGFDLRMRFDEAFTELGNIDLIVDFTSVLIKQAHHFRKFKKIYWIHGPKSHMGPAELAKFNLRLKSYDKIAVVSKYLKEELESLLPNLKDKVVVVYNPFDFDRIRSESLSTSEISDSDRLLLKQPYIVAVGRFALEKDYISLIRAYAILKKNGFSKKLYIIGDGSERAIIESEIRTLDLADDVLLLGARKNPYIWMKNSDFFVHSANIEGFGLVIVEAMVLGKAVVVTDSPVGPKEILDYGKYGVLVPVGNPESLAAGIERLANSESERTKFERLSEERCQIYSSANVIAEFNSVVESLI